MAIDLLSIQPHQISRDLSGYITYIYGRPKIGKTSLAAQAEDCLLIATERGYNAIPGIIPQDVTSWSEMRQVYRELKKPEVKARFKTLIIDTIDLAAKYCTNYICNQQDISELGDLPYGKGYNLMRNEFESVFNSLAQMGYAIIFISHAQDSVVTLEDKTEYVKIIPSLSPAKVNAIIENMADVYGYAHTKENDGTGRAVLTIRANDDSVACGCRFKYMDSEIPFDYDSLVDALGRAIDAEEKSTGEEYVINETFKPVKKQEFDFKELKESFKSLVEQIQNNVSGEDFSNTWAPMIVHITDKYLGKGKKVNDCNPNQAEQLYLIVEELKDEVGKGL